MPSSRTKLGKLAIGDADPVDFLLRFADFDAGVRRELVTAEGTSGTFFTDDNLIREARRIVTPSLTCEPTATELMHLLGWGLGPGTGTPLITFVPQVDSVLKYMYWKPEQGDQFFITDAGMDKMTISATVGGILNVSCEIVARTFDTTRNDFPAVVADFATSPFVLSDLSATGGAFVFDAATRQPNGFTLRIDNMIDRTRLLNSLTLTRVQKMNQGFGVSFDVPSGDNPGLWEAGVPESVGMTAVFTNEATGEEFTITAPAIRFPAQSPRHARGSEGFVTIDGTCVRVGGTGHPVTCFLTIP